MEKNEYWVNFWKTNTIVNKATPHEMVGRTIAGVPIEEEKWNKVLLNLEQELNLKESDTLLDIGAGSGVISIPFAKKTKQVTAVDISDKLLSEMKSIQNITLIEGDARELNFDSQSFDKIVIYFAIQHFTEEETTQLLQKCYNWLKPNGILYIGDIPDNSLKFNFFNNQERQKDYFNSLLTSKPIIGTWFQKDFFEYLGNFLGFSKSQIISQDVSYINAHYRYDAKFIK